MANKDWYKLTFQIDSDLEDIIIWKLNEKGIFSYSFEYLIKMITNIEVPTSNRFGVIFVFLFVLFEWFMRKDERNPFYGLSRKLRYPIYLMLSLSIIEFFDRSLQSSFIYFQF